jgi:hypothetical protein
MKKIALTLSRHATKLLVLCALVMTLAVTASAQGDQDFTVVNATGVEIHELYVSPHSADDWQEDILGRDTLASGEFVDIVFSRKEKTKLWDLRIVDGEGTAIEWPNLNLLEISKVTLHYNKKTGKVWADIE